MQKMLTRNLPDPEQVEGRSLAEQVWASPFLLPVRLFWNTLLDFRAWWALLIPALLLMGLRTYRRERRQYTTELSRREARRTKA